MSVPATVIVRVKPDNEGPLRMIAERRVELTQVGEELTVVRFELGEEGQLVPGSIHALPRALRSARPG